MWTAGDGQSNNGYGYAAPASATAVLEPKEVKPPGLQGFSDRQFHQGFPPLPILVTLCFLLHMMRFFLTWWKPRYVSMEWVAKKSSPWQSRIIRNPFKACNEEIQCSHWRILWLNKTVHTLICKKQTTKKQYFQVGLRICKKKLLGWTIWKKNLV